MSGKKIIEIGAADFQKEVLAQERVVVDFYSTECPPCEALATKFEPLSELYGDDIRFVKIFRQGNRELAAELGVGSSPTLLFYRSGERTGEVLTGAVKRSALMRNLDALLPAGARGGHPGPHPAGGGLLRRAHPRRRAGRPHGGHLRRPGAGWTPWWWTAACPAGRSPPPTRSPTTPASWRRCPAGSWPTPCTSRPRRRGCASAPPWR